MAPLLAVWMPALEQLPYPAEMILVDDGSPDDTAACILAQVEAHGSALQACVLPANIGQHRATLQGLLHAQYPWRLTVDDDLQVRPDVLVGLFERQQVTGATVIYGMYQHVGRPRVLNKGSQLLAGLMRRFGHYNLGGSSTRLIHHTVVEQLQKAPKGFLFLEALLPRVPGVQIANVQVPHYPSNQAASRYSMRRRMRIFAQVLWHYTSLPRLFLLLLAGWLVGVALIIPGWAKLPYLGSAAGLALLAGAYQYGVQRRFTLQPLWPFSRKGAARSSDVARADKGG